MRAPFLINEDELMYLSVLLAADVNNDRARGLIVPEYRTELLWEMRDYLLMDGGHP